MRRRGTRHAGAAAVSGDEGAAGGDVGGAAQGHGAVDVDEEPTAGEDDGGTGWLGGLGAEVADGGDSRAGADATRGNFTNTAFVDAQHQVAGAEVVDY
ncbi:hypothetical protein [Streptomyces sp. NPDC101206]|uniref:hypothetical protein n=1 Tax=Streptomyces sp. NPDC101206 TaxID=3366128 RepID=UPI0037F84BA2